MPSKSELFLDGLHPTSPGVPFVRAAPPNALACHNALLRTRVALLQEQHAGAVLAQMHATVAETLEGVRPRVVRETENLVKDTNMLCEFFSGIFVELHCKTCFDVFQKPHTLLACGHSHCKSCIKPYVYMGERPPDDCNCTTTLEQAEWACKCRLE